MHMISLTTLPAPAEHPDLPLSRRAARWWPLYADRIVRRSRAPSLTPRADGATSRRYMAKVGQGLQDMRDSGSRSYGRVEIDERFDRGSLDEQVWTAAYLPAWSSHRAAAATYALDGEGLRLTIPPDQPLWCPDLHDGPLRVSAVQSGNWSGPVGGTRGQQPFRDGLIVREAQPTRWGFTPHYGRVEVQCRAILTGHSMFSAWMVGLEDVADRCGEICIVEVFGDTLATGEDGRPVVALGCGIHAFRDPRLVEEFSADPYPLDITVDHRYSVDWRPGSMEVFVDDVPVKTVCQAPDYPMQLILGIFDFPDRAPAGQVAIPIPELAVRRVLGRSRTTAT
jgi:Glycosyl hydrolases family 16